MSNICNVKITLPEGEEHPDFDAMLDRIRIVAAQFGATIVAEVEVEHDKPKRSRAASDVDAEVDTPVGKAKGKSKAEGGTS